MNQFTAITTEMLGLSIPTADWLRIVVVENFLWLLDLDNLVLVGASGRGNAGQWIFALRRSNIFTSYHDLSCQRLPLASASI